MVVNKLRVVWWGNYPAALSQIESDWLAGIDVGVCVSTTPIGDEPEEWEEDEEDE